jgi:uncharacterized membrane protein
LSSKVLSSFLFIAGVLHLIRPGLFLAAMPPFIPFHLELIYFTGFLEILFAVGLLINKTRQLSAYLCAIYFIAILPAHFHVSMNHIPMFGIESPVLLWFRTVFQGVFIYWAYFAAKNHSALER